MLEGFTLIKKQKARAKNAPVLIIDKYNHIALNKACTEILMENGEYCNLWFDDNNKRIAITAGEYNDDSKRINKNTYISYSSRYIKEKTSNLLKNCWVRDQYHTGGKITITGKYNKEHKAIIFDLNNKSDVTII